MPGMGDIPIELLKKYNVQGPRYTSYPPVPSWNEQFKEIDYERLIINGNHKNNPRPLSLYFHLPFCEELCYFCACTTVITGKNHSLEAPYISNLFKEIEWLAERINQNRPVIQLHWGGGTPTYLNLGHIEKLMKKIRSCFNFDPSAELGVEVDPRVTTEDHLKLLGNLGFNRISMGVQDFNSKVQETVHRIQTFEATQKLVQEARRLNFISVNIDLIYGLPHQTPDSFKNTIELILKIDPDRLAVYSYAFVPWMKHYQELYAEHLPQEKEKFEIFLTALNMFNSAGYKYVGMDHFAKPTDEMSLAHEKGTLWRNFMGYTTKEGTDLFGLGMSSISSLDDGFSQNQRKLKDYQAQIQNGGSAVLRGFVMSEDDKIRRAVIQNLMCHAVLDKSIIERAYNIRFDDYFKDSLLELESLVQDGLVELSTDQIKPTIWGRLLLRNIAMKFDAYLPKPGENRVFSRTI